MTASGNEPHYTAQELVGAPGMRATSSGVTRWFKENEIPVRRRAGTKAMEVAHGRLPKLTRDFFEARRIQAVAATLCPLPHGPSAEAGAALGATIAAEAKAAQENISANRIAAAAQFEALPKKRQQEALAKLELLKARDAFMQRAGLKSIKPASEKFSTLYNAGQIPLPTWVCEYARRTGALSVSWSSLNRWRKQYEAGGLLFLANGHKGAPGIRKLPEPAQEFIQGLITSYPTIKDKRLIDACAARFHGQDLSQSTIRYYAKKFRNDNKGQLLYLADPDAWRNRQMLALGSASEQIVALNQLWEMDGSPTDVMLKDGRHAITACLDVWSRRAKMLVTPTAKATTVSALIRRCLLAWGCPPATRAEQNYHEGIKTDNGKDYTAIHIDAVLDALQIHQPLCPPFSPEKKPHVERFFRTFAHGLAELFPGFIGHNVAERKAIEARRTFAQRLMQQGGDPVQVELTGAEFQALCDRWVEAIYHQDVHGELGMSPAAKARSWTGPVRRIENERALDMLLMPSAGTRVLGKKGLKVDHGYYIAAEFGLIDVGTTVRVLEDPTDLGTVYVYRLEGEFLCVAQDPERTGIDRAEIAARAKAIQKNIMQEGARELRKTAKKVGAERAFEEILLHRESLIANVTELPRRSESFVTDALEQAGIAADARQRQVIEPEQRRTERAALEAEMRDTGKLVPLPNSDIDRLRFCRDLQRRLSAQEALGDRDREWLAKYMRSPEYRSFAEVEADLAIAK